jgi:hypothetical protein
MNIQPTQIELTGRDTLRFEAFENGAPVAVDWKIEPTKGRGTIDPKHGVYTAPFWTTGPKTVVVTATHGGATAFARVTLSTRNVWLFSLFTYLILILGGIVTVLFWRWPEDRATPSVMSIGPQSVVLKAGESQPFVASEPAKWSDNAPNGEFAVPADAGPGRTEISAWRQGDGLVAKAAVRIADTSLTVNPVQPFLRSGETVKLTAQTAAKEPTWTGEICRPDGTCTAPADIDHRRIVLATVTTKDPVLVASVPIQLVPGQPGSLRIIVWVMLLGALGGWLHATRSLVAFAGSKQFVETWGPFYLARPFVGAVLALFVFLAFRGQLTGDGGHTNLYAVGAVAALVGLFSDGATAKLKEMFDAFLGPKQDLRANKLGEAGTAKPTITGVDPPTLTLGAVGNLVLKGSGFVDKCNGHVDGNPRPTLFQGGKQVTVTLVASDVAAKKTLTVTVVNPNGDVSTAVSVPVG